MHFLLRMIAFIHLFNTTFSMTSLTHSAWETYPWGTKKKEEDQAVDVFHLLHVTQ